MTKLHALTVRAMFVSAYDLDRISDHDPDSIRSLDPDPYLFGIWIRIREGKNDPQK